MRDYHSFQKNYLLFGDFAVLVVIQQFSPGQIFPFWVSKEDTRCPSVSGYCYLFVRTKKTNQCDMIFEAEY